MHAVDFADAGDLAEVQDEFVEVADVDGFYDKVDDGITVWCGFGVDGANVGAIVGDDGCEFFEDAGAVFAEDGEADGVGVGLGGPRILGIGESGPFDLDAAVGFVEEVLNVRTAASVDGDALAAGYITDDLFTTDGITTASAVDKEVILAFDLK